MYYKKKASISDDGAYYKIRNGIRSLTFLSLIDFPKHIDTIGMGKAILCFNGLQVELSTVIKM